MCVFRSESLDGAMFKLKWHKCLKLLVSTSLKHQSPASSAKSSKNFGALDKLVAGTWHCSSKHINCVAKLSKSTRRPCCAFNTLKSSSVMNSEYKKHGSSSSASRTHRACGINISQLLEIARHIFQITQIHFIHSQLI